MKKLKLFSLLGVVVVIGLYSCSKGSAGATGATGPAGPAGPDDVYYSAWVAADFVGTVQDGDSLYQQIIQAPNLTQIVLDSGMIVSYLDYVYQNPSGSGTISDVEPINGQGIYEDYYVGEVIYTTFAWSNGGAATYYNGSYSLRYVIIPGTILATNSALQGLSKAQISTMSFDKLSSIVGNPGVTIKSN